MEWIASCCPAFGWGYQKWEGPYQAAQAVGSETAVTSSVVATVLVRWWNDGLFTSWEGTATELSAATLTQSRSKTAKASPVVAKLRPAKILETYSAGLKLAQVASGEADIYANIYPAFSDWDICAGHILVEEAGGRVTTLDGREIRYGLPGFAQTGGLLASNGRLHEKALLALK